MIIMYCYSCTVRRPCSSHYLKVAKQLSCRLNIHPIHMHAWLGSEGKLLLPDDSGWQPCENKIFGMLKPNIPILLSTDICHCQKIGTPQYTIDGWLDQLESADSVDNHLMFMDTLIHRLLHFIYIHSPSQISTLLLSLKVQSWFYTKFKDCGNK